jgi:arsenite methyltransferase
MIVVDQVYRGEDVLKRKIARSTNPSISLLCVAVYVLIASAALVRAHAPGKSGLPQEIQRMHQDSDAYIAMLEGPQRDAEQKPDEVVAALNLKEGETVADIGAGSGYFSFRFAQKVGDSGRVYAVDIDPDMIIHMNRRIRDLKLKNVVTVLSAPDDPLLADASVDRFFICNTWHHIENQAQYLALMKKMLKPRGQIIMVDYKKDSPKGSLPRMRISREDLIEQMNSGGFTLSKEHTFLPYQYFLIFESRLTACRYALRASLHFPRVNTLVGR